MSYDKEQNRIKVAKYRTRKGLKEAGYSGEEIDTIIQDTDWAVTTPVDILSEYIEESQGPQAVSARAGDNDWDSENEEEYVPARSRLSWVLPVIIAILYVAVTALRSKDQETAQGSAQQ